MSAATATRTSLRGRLEKVQRLEALLDYMAKGAQPPLFCADCVAAIADRCEVCAQLEADYAVICAAMGKVQQAADEDDALEVCRKTVMRLAGFPRTAEVRS